MRTMRNLALAAAAAAALALAGCGGGGSSSSGGPGTTPPPPPPANLTSLFAAAQNASNAADMAEKAATAAQKSATDSAKMLSTTEVGGQSMKAMMSAQAILKAMADAAKAVMDAEKALADANKAKTDAAAIADSHPQKAALMQAIEDAIKDAQDAVAETKKVRDGTAIKNAVAEVQGSNKKGTPRSVATAVGKDIAAALSPGDQRGGTRISHGSTAPETSVAKALKYETDDHQGMTWAEIVGEANVMMKRLGNQNSEIPVASITGMTAADVAPEGTDLSSTGNSDGNGTSGSNYKAIPGTVWCLGGTDGCKVTNGKLGAGWYFSPTSPKAYYQNKTDDSSTGVDESLEYEAETLYASYGHWLTSAGDPLVWTVNTFAMSSGGTSVNLVAGTDEDGLADSATYSGKAAGMSVRKTGSGDSQTVDSGRFTADVSLSAKFGTSPTVSGTINNFVGDAVGSGWSVALGSATLATDSQNGITTASGRDGVWSAQAYGSASAKRPAGIFGGFTAHFTDGHATGAFATR